MRTSIIITLAAAAAIAGCTSETTVVRPVAVVPAPAPAPTVVYQAPAPVVYAGPAPTVYPAPPARQVLVTYTGSSGFPAAQRTAAIYCGQHFGSSSASLLTDDRLSGRATFTCAG